VELQLRVFLGGASIYFLKNLVNFKGKNCNFRVFEGAMVPHSLCSSAPVNE
jgi:hypothetical protein